MFSMKTKFLSLVIVVIIFSMVMIVPSDMTQTADAAKAKGVKNQQYGQATSTKVCGDRLCTAEDFTKEGTKKEIAPRKIFNQLQYCFEQNGTSLRNL